MIHLADWISADLLRPLGLALLHFLWQGAALAALAALVLTLCRQASTRYLVAVTVLVAMVAAPAGTFYVLTHTHTEVPFNADSSRRPALASQISWHNSAKSAPLPPIPDKPYLILVEAWFFGVLLLSLRTVGGVAALERLRRKNSAPLDEAILGRCLALQRRMRLTRIIRYCESLHLDAPAVIGWFHPIVVLPLSALTGLSETQLNAVIAHELAHIRRLDAFINLFQIAAESLLFYHPAIWWLNRRIRAERENCCDDVAISVCGSPVEYARALTLMEEWRAAPALAMAINRAPLAERVRRLLGIPSDSSMTRTASLTAGVFCLSVALFAGNAFFGLARATASPQAPSKPQIADASHRDLVIMVQADRPTSEEPIAPAPRPAPGQQPKASPAPEPAAAPRSQVSYLDGLKAAGYDNLSVDELVAMKVQGITPAYIRAIQEAGFKPSPDELIGLKVQGVTPEYIHELHAAGLKPDVNELIGLKVQGIKPDYVHQMKELDLQTDADNLIGLKVQGVTPQYVTEMRAAGLKPDTDELIGMKVQGITPAYVREMKDLGIHPDANGLIGLKVQGVTPEYVKSLQATGLKLDADDIVSAKVQGITPEFIQKVQSHGFKNLDLNQILELKRSGVLEK